MDNLIELIEELETLIEAEDCEKYMVIEPGYHICAAKIAAYRQVIGIIKDKIMDKL